MALIKIEKIKKCCSTLLNPFDIVYVTGKILVVNPLYYRSENHRYSDIRRLVKRYGIVMYADYVFNRNRRMLYAVQPEHISIDLLYGNYAPLRDARIILASSITRIRSLDEPVMHRTYMLKPSTKALLNLRNHIDDVTIIKGMKPYHAILISVKKFGPLLNLNDIVFDGIRTLL